MLHQEVDRLVQDYFYKNIYILFDENQLCELSRLLEWKKDYLHVTS